MFGLSAKNFPRYTQIGRLLYKYGRADLVQQSGMMGQLGDVQHLSAEEAAKPEELAQDLEEMGPAFVKLGQLLSTRPDFLPEPYLEALTRLQDDAESVSWEEIRQTIVDELGAEPETSFGSFDQKPLASASLGQVHRATMRDGREVVVKIQRPGIAKQLSEDLEALAELATFLTEHTEFGKEFQLQRMIESLESSLYRELNYVTEAQNAQTLAENLKSHSRIVIPQAITDLTTRRVLTMQYLSGAKITELSKAVLIELDRNEIANDIFRAYLHQVLVDGVFHADPHPGNLSLTQDRRIVLMDFGLVVRTSPTMRRQMVKLVLAIADGDGEGAASIAEEIGEPRDDFDFPTFRRAVTTVVAENVGSTVEQMTVGKTMMQLQQTAGRAGLALPDQMLLLGKTLMNLDRVVLVLAPDFDPNLAFRKHADEIMAKHGKERVSLNSAYHALLESAEFIQELPSRANKLLKLASENQLRLDVNAVDEDLLLKGIHRIANRITAGLVVAALIVGAALIMRIDASWKIVGYPAIPTICFALASIAGSYLFWKATFTDDY